MAIMRIHLNDLMCISTNRLHIVAKVYSACLIITECYDRAVEDYVEKGTSLVSSLRSSVSRFRKFMRSKDSVCRILITSGPGTFSLRACIANIFCACVDHSVCVYIDDFFVVYCLYH